MHQLLSVLSERISAGLKHKTLTTCSKWAEQYRVMGQPYPGKWNFDHHPWTREMHDCTDELIIGQKAAQMGYTEVALNKTFYNIDVNGYSCLYILPAAKPDASDFSSARFDPALEMSKHLEDMFSDVKNVHHKRAGNANLFIRGSRSRSQLKSIPVAFIVFDELDEMDQKNLSLADERQSGQLNVQSLKISTPTIEGKGISSEFERSTQENFFFKCPQCNKLTQLIFPECLVITSDDPNSKDILNTHIICKECKVLLPHEDKIHFLRNGIWVPKRTDRLSRGFHVNQLYSMQVEPYKLAQLFLKAQHNPTDEQEFYNSKLGETHTVKGAQVTDQELEACMGSHEQVYKAPDNALTTMGVDVGSKYLHIEIDQWFFDNNEAADINLSAKAKLLLETKITEFEQLDEFMHLFNIRFCVIDAQPERRKSLEFAQRWNGRVKVCFYPNGINGKNIKINPDTEHTISVDRTSWLDLSLGRFRRAAIILPMNISLEYKEHIKALARIYSKDSSGNPIGKYDKADSKDDHFAHSRTYSEIALPLGISLERSYDIGNIF